MKIFAAIALSALALVAAGCGDDDDSTTGSAPAAAEEKSGDAIKDEKAGDAMKDEKSAASGTEIKLAESQFGQILFDGSDQAIYLFDKESGPTSECYGACAHAWPPVTTAGRPAAGAGVDSSLLGTTERNDGTTQVTYNGQPLYYYVDDPRGEALCHNVEEFGGLWLVVDGGGEAVS